MLVREAHQSAEHGLRIERRRHVEGVRIESVCSVGIDDPPHLVELQLRTVFRLAEAGGDAKELPLLPTRVAVFEERTVVPDHRRDGAAVVAKRDAIERLAVTRGTPLFACEQQEELADVAGGEVGEFGDGGWGLKHSALIHGEVLVVAPLTSAHPAFAGGFDA